MSRDGKLYIPLGLFGTILEIMHASDVWGGRDVRPLMPVSILLESQTLIATFLRMLR